MPVVSLFAAGSPGCPPWWASVAPLPPPGRHRLYLDRGTTDLEAFYAPHQAFVDELLHDGGWRAPALVSRVFEGTGHNERDWGARVELPLVHLLGPR